MSNPETKPIQNQRQAHNKSSNSNLDL